MNEKPPSARTWRNPHFVRSDGAQAIAASLLLGRRLRDKARNELALGTFIIDIPDPSTVTAMALAGFDFVVLDMEHSAIDFTRLENLINAGRAAGIATIVRPWGEDTGLIGKVLDLGAHGIMAPHVGTPERARQIVDQARFAPAGQRGFSPLSKFDAFEEPLKSIDESVYLIVQIEGRDAIEQLQDIAAVPGIDAIFVGPYDLALSLDVPPGSDAVTAAASRIAEGAAGRLALGIYMDDASDCGGWYRRGYTLQCVSFDGRMLADRARELLRNAKSGL
jgi:2-keto-3-deoxy-L-rhamnonate aldolase RhmA